MTLLHRCLAFLRRDYRLAGTSRLGLTWQIVSIFFAVPTLFYLGRLIQPAAFAHLAPFGGDYFAFVIVGVAAFGFLIAGTSAPPAALRHEQMIGTLDALLTTPTPAPVVALGTSLWTVVVAAVQGMVYLVLAVVIFGLEVPIAGVPGAAVILVLALGIFSALGVIAAAFVVVFRHADPLSGLFAAASALLGGVFYPTSVLPLPLQRLAELVPLTHALRALRLALLQGHGLGVLWREVVILVLFLAVLAPLAMLTMRWAIRQAKISGTLGAY